MLLRGKQPASAVELAELAALTKPVIDRYGEITRVQPNLGYRDGIPIYEEEMEERSVAVSTVAVKKVVRKAGKVLGLPNERNVSISHTTQYFSKPFAHETERLHPEEFMFTLPQAGGFTGFITLTQDLATSRWICARDADTDAFQSGFDVNEPSQITRSEHAVLQGIVTNFDAIRAYISR